MGRKGFYQSQQIGGQEVRKENSDYKISDCKSSVYASMLGLFRGGSEK